ncbi:hypothetical protein TNCV_633831 [Trichonephila clavipes]|nr:hypothetical protein TNCV_633831 [Trichonephila clavipes]
MTPFVQDRSTLNLLKLKVLTLWHWARTRDKASHGLIPVPLGYRGQPNALERQDSNSDSDVIPARISSQSSLHCWRSPLPHASALIQRDFGCVLGVQQTKQLPHLAKVDLSEPAREAIQSGDLRRTFGQCVPRVVARPSNGNILLHYPVEIWLWPSPEDKEGPLAQHLGDVALAI